MTVFETLSLTSRLPLAVLVGLGGAAAVLVLAGVLRRGRGAAARAGAVLALFLALLDPRLTEEARQPRDDVAVVVVDDSPSQAIGDRRRQTEAALAALLDRLKAQERLSVRVERLGAGENFDDGTRLFAAVRRATADVPRGRLGGVALITDGQVHDGPPREWGGPVHVLLTGRPDEGDRRLVVGRPPGYGIVGKSVPVAVTVEDRGGDGAPANAVLTVRRDGGAARTLTVPVGRTYVFQADISHGGANVLEFEVEPGPAELSLANNRAAVTIGGVRDRLKVLLLSGRPHPGERTWRNLLKADANVDLVHFTILRPIDKDDFTPLNELALIAFPMRELFEEKLGDFDLVIFDRFGVHNPLPDAYLENVVRYVRKGGAVLVSAGPEFTDVAGLSETPLGAILPAAPTGRTLDEVFLPTLTGTGTRHPVTGSLAGAGTAETPPRWGRWLRHVEAAPRGGDVLMTGIGDRPLLVLDHVGEGRVALLLSDGIWLWTRGYEGGGPQAELLRRLAHWLMKEPELEENALTAEARGGLLTVVRRSLEAGPSRATVAFPDGTGRTLDLIEEEGGRAKAAVPVTEPGLYRIDDGRTSTVAAVGALNPLEFSDLAATDRVLRPAALASGGGVHWLAGGGVPEVRRVSPGAVASGGNWMGFLANGDYQVIGVEQIPLAPSWLILPLVLGSLVLAWYREGR